MARISPTGASCSPSDHKDKCGLFLFEIGNSIPLPRSIDVAEANGALGWKVNGAGGEGGSVTILSGTDRRQRRRMLAAISEANAEYRNIPVSLSREGVRSWRVCNGTIIE